MNPVRVDEILDVFLLSGALSSVVVVCWVVSWFLRPSSPRRSDRPAWVAVGGFAASLVAGVIAFVFFTGGSAEMGSLRSSTFFVLTFNAVVTAGVSCALLLVTYVVDLVQWAWGRRAAGRAAGTGPTPRSRSDVSRMSEPPAV
ncbi:hypothetical protein [Cellulomonas sp. S1-8]|uniref:hypothetical protein n=1 Tax=Cellulomonas sp. S1-8 TaxID=2904790 RepID=UPI002244505D|nr:hypothetical protein [Cellulomonas sp. S1-8]UZN03309.1 hypothetical protein OKX07_20040 [Cellulomonas sp. S1-8]